MSKNKNNMDKTTRPNRSVWGDILLYFFLLLVAMVMVFPIVYAVSSALKPLDELFMFPPRIFAQNPTLDNFSDLFVTMGKSWERVGLHFPDMCSIRYLLQELVQQDI